MNGLVMSDMNGRGLGTESPAGSAGYTLHVACNFYTEKSEVKT